MQKKKQSFKEWGRRGDEHIEEAVRVNLKQLNVSSDEIKLQSTVWYSRRLDDKDQLLELCIV